MTETSTERWVIFSPEIPGPRIGEARRSGRSSSTWPARQAGARRQGPLRLDGRESGGTSPAASPVTAGSRISRRKETLSNDLGQLRGRVLIAGVKPGNVEIHWPEGEVVIDSGRRSPQAGIPDYNAVVSLEPVARTTIKAAPAEG